MKKILVATAASVIILAGCGNSEKANVIGPALAIDNASVAQSAAQEAIIGSDMGSASGGTFSGAPSYMGAPLNAEAASAKVMPRASYGTTPDAGGYYTVNLTVADFKAAFSRFSWTSSVAMKTKVTDKDGIDVLKDYIAGTDWLVLASTKGPLSLETVIEASNDFRSVTSNFKKKVTYDINASSKLVVENAGDMTLTTTVQRFRTGWTGNFTITNTDKYTVPNWVHGETITYSGSAGRSARFNLVRDNDPASSTWGYHTGDGTVAYNDATVAKVHFNGDGTAYYTLTSENYATQHTFNERAAK